RLEGPDQMQWTARMRTEQENVRAALRWLLDGGEFEPVGRLLRCLVRFWWASGQVSEARSWAAEILARRTEVPATIRSRACFVAGPAALVQGAPAAEAVLAEGRGLGRASGDAWAEGFSALSEAALMPLRGDFAGAMDLLRQAQRLLHAAGDAWGFDMTLA